MARNWIGIASAEHVARGRQGNFMQVCHGKGGPLRRIAAGDRVAYYSSNHVLGGPKTHDNRCQCFTAIGIARDDHIYQADMGGGFVPFRRDIDWLAAKPASILPLLDRMDFTRGKKNWGYAFRFGLLEISAHDMDVIFQAMRDSKAAREAKTVSLPHDLLSQPAGEIVDVLPGNAPGTRAACR
jgi:hypothetical protein